MSASTSTTFITGATGFIGGYVAARLLADPAERLAVLVRAKSTAEATEKLWRGLQPHCDAETFWRWLERVEFVPGDLHAPGLGISAEQRAGLRGRVDSVLHIAASLNRKSEKACLNSNLRGTLSVVKLAREIADARGLRRFSHVSTVAVAGHRSHETVQEDTAIEWDRSDYDPYARTKKFCEHMVRELLPDVSRLFLRPSIVMGDARFPETTQFDMVRAFTVLAELPLVPLSPDGRLDIVNADFVGDAIATLHRQAQPEHEIYHLSSGEGSHTAGEIAEALSRATGRRLRFLPRLESGFGRSVELLGGMRTRGPITGALALLKVFLPYITYDAVFDNQRVCAALGRSPVSFTEYCAPLYRWVKDAGFKYPYRPLPARIDAEAA